MTTTIKLGRTSTGEPALDSNSLGLLFGRPAALVREYMFANIDDRGRVDFPKPWMRAGRRRSREAAAATGSSELEAILACLARRDLGAEIIFVDGAATP